MIPYFLNFWMNPKLIIGYFEIDGFKTKYETLIEYASQSDK